MKKLVFAFGLIIALGCSSCQKYTCTCVNNSTGASSTVQVSASSTSDAIIKCAQQTQGGTSTCSY